MRKNIYFYCPSRKIGGEQQLYIRCSEYLSRYSNFDVYYVDYEDGFSACQLKGTKVKMIKYSQEESVVIKSFSCVVIALAYVDIIDNVMTYDKSVNFLLWSLQPSNLTGKILIRNHYLVILPFLRKRIKNVISFLCDRGVIRFMDFNNYFTVHKYLKVNLDELNYLPVPIRDSEIRVIEYNNIKPLSTDVLNFMWLSRIDQDKKYTLLTIMNELTLVNKTYHCCLYVAGDGDAITEVKDFAKKCSYDIVFLGRIFNDDLNRLIDEKIDIGISMGTSALEIAKRGKPVIMNTVFSKVYSPGVISNYIFLHQQYGYSLGAPDLDVSGQSVFFTKIQELLSNYINIAYADYMHTKTKHSLKTTCELIISYLMNLNFDVFSDEHQKIKELCNLIHLVRKFTFR